MRVPDEFVAYVQANIVPKRGSAEIKSINGIIDEALYIFVTDPDKKSDKFDFALRADLGDGVFFIHDPKFDTLIKMEIKENKLFCHHHNFSKTHCPHTIWGSLNKEIEKKLPKIEPPYYNSKRHTTCIRVRRRLFDKFNDMTHDQRKILHCSENDILMKIVLEHYC